MSQDLDEICVQMISEVIGCIGFGMHENLIENKKAREKLLRVYTYFGWIDPSRLIKGGGRPSDAEVLGWVKRDLKHITEQQKELVKQAKQAKKLIVTTEDQDQLDTDTKVTPEKLAEWQRSLGRLELDQDIGESKSTWVDGPEGYIESRLNSEQQDNYSNPNDKDNPSE